MKTSKLAAKIVTKLFLVLLMAALAFLLNENNKLDHVYLDGKQIWAFVPPILLILGFITLLVICVRQKYSKPDMNWLLVVNTVVLMAYGITLFIRIHDMINQVR
ncbi:hypothetical protein FPZ42_01240 [Mucilaginibacter achroorhodeus]|uniref:Uncharacterized protein n=1 Tax=Mucilaginibacter achroorhodeus TaxID=2599294 RepID=A0A563U963_9SPHI|nr:hypothetical protein [Mucilaginibacter achroorhodeus]TWR27866.1 hypothetical protein FPZ42_01240 [Mucilaginibacter achroorhodeus]